MKGYPLIYSRTKYHDCVPPFLIMPAALNDADSYAGNIMFEVDQLKDVRRVVFSANDHLIYGVSFLTYLYFDRISEKNAKFAETHSSERDYCFDYTKRKTIFFTGVAIPKSELKAGYVPDITMEELWDIYIRFLKEQWELDESEVRCIKLDDPVLNISEKKYSSDFTPTIEKIQNINVIKNYTGNEQDIIDYFCNKIINGEKCSFISDANSKTLCQRLKFTHAVVSESIVKSLAIQPKSQSINQPNLSSIKTEKTQTPQLSHVSSNLDQRRKELEEKRLESEKKKQQSFFGRLSSHSVTASNNSCNNNYNKTADLRSSSLDFRLREMVKQLEPKKTEKAVFYCITPNFPKYNELLEITHELISGQETKSIAHIAYIPSTKEIRIYMKGD